jgi:RNA polymerase sigma factor (sigma-70 family)
MVSSKDLCNSADPLVRLGDVEFEDFVRARGTALLRYGYVLSGNADDAAHLVQEALLKLSGAWRRVRNKDNPESYVRTIMARQHISWWRRRRREHVTDEVPEGSYTDDHSFGELWKELATLPRKQRVVLVLRYYGIATGKMATIGMGSSWMGVGTSSEPSTIIYWEGKPGTFRVLNLAAVPPGQ